MGVWVYIFIACVVLAAFSFWHHGQTVWRRGAYSRYVASFGLDPVRVLGGFNADGFYQIVVDSAGDKQLTQQGWQREWRQWPSGLDYERLRLLSGFPPRHMEGRGDWAQFKWLVGIPTEDLKKIL